MTEHSCRSKPLWVAYESVAMLLGLGFLALMCLLWLPFAMILHPLLPRRWGQPLGRRVIMGGFRIYTIFLELFCACRFDLAGLDKLREQGALVVVANHPSLLDVVMIVSRLPNAVCVMKAQLMDNILFGAAARLARYIRNDSALDMVRDARMELQRGAQLVIFPEGTRTTSFPINPCLPTAGLIAKRSGTPVQALCIEFSSPYLGKQWPLFKRPELPLRFRVRPGERFPAPQDVSAFATTLEEYFRSELASPETSATPRRKSPRGQPPAPAFMSSASTTHIVLIPSYNPGSKVAETVLDARRQWNPVWVVVDGSTDGSTEALQTLAADDPGLTVLVLPENRGKGSAVLEGISKAAAAGFTHALTMDSDGQHPADLIPAFMLASQTRPEAMVLGKPVFDADAPALRVYGRKVSNGWANLETLWMGIGDSLYGFRVYPIAPLIGIMQANRWMRRFDFDPEAVVRLCWAGVRPINIDAPVRYFRADEGGVSHFRYLRDNTLLTWMHTRLFLGFLLRLPALAWRRLQSTT